MDVAVIVTTYEWPQALSMTLQSLLMQSTVPQEIVVADDGSGPATAQRVKEILGGAGGKWVHVRHEHFGVRQSRIKNLAVTHCNAPYLVFVDQDVVLHPHFVSDHISMAQEGVFLQGKRCLLSQHSTERMIAADTVFYPPPWARGLSNRKNAFRGFRLGRLLSRSKAFETSLRGCNLSMFRSDLLRVDGFDEIFDQSWGREDSDLCYRLFHAGLQIKNLWFLALQYHLYHGVVKAWERERLDREIERNLRERRVKAIKGLSQLGPEGVVIAGSEHCGQNEG